MSVLRIVWPIVAALLAGLLIAKFVLLGLIGAPVTGPLVGVAFCFYLLFMLEGLQVAGLKIKDLDSDSIEQYLAGNPVTTRKVMPVYKTFSGNFDGFVTGRQVFVIMTVVSLAFLLRTALVFPVDVLDAPFAAKLPLAKSVFGFLDSTIFAFATATLVPAWISQLLPQFMADKKAISFICLPGAGAVLKLAMFLDKIELGQPAKVLLNMFRGADAAAEHIPIGKNSYYEASMNFYGRAKKQHDISFELGSPTKIRETLCFIFGLGHAQSIDHTIRLSAPIIGDLKARIDLPENVHAHAESRNTNVDGSYIYWIKFVLNQPLPRENAVTDSVDLVLEYETEAYTDEKGVKQTAEFSSQLPTAAARISLNGSEWLLKKPDVSISEVEGVVSAAPDIDAVNVTTPEATNNSSEILIGHPTIGSVYRFEFEAMNVSVNSREASATERSLTASQ